MRTGGQIAINPDPGKFEVLDLPPLHLAQRGGKAFLVEMRGVDRQRELRAGPGDAQKRGNAYGGLVNRMPTYARVFMLFTMANVGLPGTSGFIGEFLTLMGTFQKNTWVAAVAASGVIFSAGYALWLYRRVVFGDLIKESLKAITDMTSRERAIFAPLIVMTILLGVYPALVTDIIGPSTAALISNFDTALAAAEAASQVASH